MGVMWLDDYVLSVQEQLMSLLVFMNYTTINILSVIICCVHRWDL